MLRLPIPSKKLIGQESAVQTQMAASKGIIITVGQLRILMQTH